MEILNAFPNSYPSILKTDVCPQCGVCRNTLLDMFKEAPTPQYSVHSGALLGYLETENHYQAKVILENCALCKKEINRRSK